ncbi:protein-arginine deiminase type-2 [Oryzias melastigma]|uniref:Protein-arginine deiminase n=1 Tax=Oryzias melastigma TaxID=30732 RepID=A0A3B3BYH8_ORYME|nr:protein-arginine deiminase type-2 [Oryzias melastigma]
MFEQVNKAAPENTVPEYQRTCRLDINNPQHVLYVVGTSLDVSIYRSAPPGSKSFSVKCTSQVNYSFSPPTLETSHHSHIPLDNNTTLLISMDRASEFENDSKLSVRYYNENKNAIGVAVLHLTGVEIFLDVDADRDGIVEENNPNKGSWKWGPDGYGAILLVNCDSESTRSKRPDLLRSRISNMSDLKDMSPMKLRTRGPSHLPEGYKLMMHICLGDSEKIRVFRSISSDKRGNSSTVKNLPLVLGPKVLSQEVPYPGDNAEMDFHVEGLEFPDADFDGLVTINLSLLKPLSDGLPETPIFTDTVIFRVAPWIMTPNTLQPEEVFVCRTTDNHQFLKEIKTLVAKSGFKLMICNPVMNRGDRWIQDEMEFGYIDSPHHRFPVVLDSPRDRELKNFPCKVLLGPDFGYVTREPQSEEVGDLDSFGNLEVSPPVTVNGKNYPLGRIIIGVAFPTAKYGRNMTKVVQDFLWAQRVQKPIALFSDWLVVGHVDEFMTFVPAPDRKGFRLLLASPDAGYKLFRELKNNGHGQARMFDVFPKEKQTTVDELLGNRFLQNQNNYIQSCIDWNRDVLKKELGLDDEDIIELPILFKLDKKHEWRAEALYPDMVNMIVLGKNLGIPKPFGPKVNGRCALEAEMCSLMGGLGLTCTFIDDYYSYHKLHGEVHCGSNVRRKPFDFQWWNMEI